MKRVLLLNLPASNFIVRCIDCAYIRAADFYSPDLSIRFSGLDKTKTYPIYCRLCHRTSQTASLMRKLGFKKVIALKGGILDWSANNFSLEIGEYK